MPELPNRRHEKFCRCVAMGHTHIPECYTAAGYKFDRVLAIKLSQVDAIRGRILDLTRERELAQIGKQQA